MKRLIQWSIDHYWLVIGLKSGVAAGDRVVTRGAYEVQHASAAKGLPAEGHVH